MIALLAETSGRQELSLTFPIEGSSPAMVLEVRTALPVLTFGHSRPLFLQLASLFLTARRRDPLAGVLNSALPQPSPLFLCGGFVASYITPDNFYLRTRILIGYPSYPSYRALLLYLAGRPSESLYESLSTFPDRFDT